MIHQPYFETVRAIVIGRFETKFGMSLKKLKLIINSKLELGNIPISLYPSFATNAAVSVLFSPYRGNDSVPPKKS